MLLVFTVLTAVMTYPQVLHLREGVHDDGDPLMLTWVLAWVGHQLPRAPAHLFDANMFYPERRTLAYSETLLLPGTVAAPLHWLGVHPIFVYNLVFLSGFVVSGAGTALLVRSLTHSSGAGLLAGIVFAFLPFRIDHYAHAQLQQTQCLPLAMWSFHRLLRTGRVRDGVLFGAFTAGQFLSCMYFGLFLIPYVAVVGGTLLIAEAGMLKRRLVAVIAAVLVAAAAVVPAGVAYLRVRDVVGERGRLEVMNGSATWQSYLAAPPANLMYGRLLARFVRPERQLFPGFLAVALAASALWPPISTLRLAYVLGLLIALDISHGIVRRVFPRGARGIRRDTPARARQLRQPAAHGVHGSRAGAARRVRLAAGNRGRGQRGSRGVCRHRPRSGRRPYCGDLRVPDVPVRQSNVSVLLDLPLAASGQRVQRLFSALLLAAR